MENWMMIAIGVGLGALGGMIHWFLPEAEKVPLMQKVGRMVVGGVAGLFFGSAGLLMALNDGQRDLIVLLPLAVPAIATGYFGLDVLLQAIGVIKKMPSPIDDKKTEEKLKAVKKDAK